MTRAGAEPRELGLGRKLLFSAIVTLAFFAAVELALSLAGVRPILVDEDPYVGFESTLELYVADRGAGVYRTAPNKLALFNDQSFPLVKESRTLRIFTVGGSTTYGRPFEDPTSFSGWLREYLRVAAPGRGWEVINAGGISYASYRVARLMEELVDHRPDLFIIYSGNNEFLEKRTYGELATEPVVLRRGRLALQRLRLWALGARALRAGRQRAVERYQLAGEVEELLDNSAGLDYYRRDPGFHGRVVEHYRINLARMVELARAAGARVILVTVPVNEKDFSPFKSQHGEALTEGQRERYATLLAAARTALAAGDAALAAEQAEAAVALDPLYAEGHYLLGRARLGLGAVAAAAAAFERAIVEDVCPLRALPEMNRAIAETADRHGVELVDFRTLLKRPGSGDGPELLLGDEQFLDHVHPTVETHGILGRALLERMAGMGLLELPPGPRRAELERRVEGAVLARVDDEAYARAFKNLSKVLLWAGKSQLAEQYARRAAEVLGEDWELHYNTALAQFDGGRMAEALVSLREALRINPRAAPAWDQLNTALARRGELAEAVAAGERAVELDPGAAGAWNNLAATRLMRGEPREAAAAARRAVELAPGFADAHNNLAAAQFDLGELAAAEAAYRRAIALKPGSAPARVNLGLALGAQGRFAEALAEFDAARELDPALAAVHLGRGRALVELGDLKGAVEALERAQRIEPENPEILEALARGLIADGRLERAQEILWSALAVVPAAARLHHLLGRTLAQQRRFAAARRAFRQAVELDPEPLQPWIDYGTLSLVEGRPDEAAGIFRDALSRAGESAALHHLLAKALLGGRGGEAAAAQRHLERAVALEPGNALAMNDLAALHEQGGRLERALELYRRAAALAPELELAERNAERLARRLGRS